MKFHSHSQLLFNTNSIFSTKFMTQHFNLSKFFPYLWFFQYWSISIHPKSLKPLPHYPQNPEPILVPAMAATGFAAQSILRRVVPSFLSIRPTTHVTRDFFSGTTLILRTPLHPSGIEISLFLACLLFDDFSVNLYDNLSWNSWARLCIYYGQRRN